jgi:hypothetical protein
LECKNGAKVVASFKQPNISWRNFGMQKLISNFNWTNKSDKNTKR